jgi:hypothetical protein
VRSLPQESTIQIASSDSHTVKPRFAGRAGLDCRRPRLLGRADFNAAELKELQKLL